MVRAGARLPAMAARLVLDADSPGHNARLQLPNARGEPVGQFAAFAPDRLLGQPGDLGHGRQRQERHSRARPP